MHKYTKTALVLLYLLQLMVVCREQLVHFYRSALESVKGEAASAPPEHGSGTFGEVSGEQKDVTTIAAPAAKFTLAAASGLLLPAAVIHEDGHEEHEHHHHDGDEHKDHTRKHKRRTVREYVIANFWHFMRALAPTGHREIALSDICRVLTFA